MTSNLDLWNAVERTDPKHVKSITGKPYKGSSPSPTYLIRKATETFGPCGIGWGFTFSERIEEGDAGIDRVHIAKVHLWYKWEVSTGLATGHIEHVGQTMFSGKRKDGSPFIDEDAPKKSVTDGLVKALSMLGFAADIFLGRFDDSKYVRETEDDIKKEETSRPSESAVIYASRFREKLHLMGTEKAVRNLWENDRAMRDQVGILKATPLHSELGQACATRIFEISQETKPAPETAHTASDVPDGADE